MIITMIDYLKMVKKETSTPEKKGKTMGKKHKSRRHHKHKDCRPSKIQVDPNTCQHAWQGIGQRPSNRQTWSSRSSQRRRISRSTQTWNFNNMAEKPFPPNAVPYHKSTTNETKIEKSEPKLWWSSFQWRGTSTDKTPHRWTWTETFSRHQKKNLYWKIQSTKVSKRKRVPLNRRLEIMAALMDKGDWPGTNQQKVWDLNGIWRLFHEGPTLQNCTCRKTWREFGADLWEIGKRRKKQQQDKSLNIRLATNRKLFWMFKRL